LFDYPDRRIASTLLYFTLLIYMNFNDIRRRNASPPSLSKGCHRIQLRHSPTEHEPYKPLASVAGVESAEPVKEAIIWWHTGMASETQDKSVSSHQQLFKSIVASVMELLRDGKDAFELRFDNRIRLDYDRSAKDTGTLGL
jgi:hypothetical protein